MLLHGYTVQDDRLYIGLYTPLERDALKSLTFGSAYDILKLQLSLMFFSLLK